MDIIVRHAVPGDYASVEAIMEQVQALHVGWRPDIYRPNDCVLSRERYDDALANDSIIVAECDGHVVGLTMFFARHAESCNHVTRDVLFVDSMAVDEPYRNMGVGRKMFDFIREIRAQKHYDAIELQVNAKNPAAMRMYKHYGFTEKSINMELI